MPGTDPFLQLKTFYQFLVPTLSDNSWDICASVLKHRTVQKGEMILKNGHVCRHISFINSGLVRMYYNLADGREKNVCFFNENNYVSDYHSFLSRKPAALNIQALELTELVETTYDDLQMMYRCVPEANLMGRLVAEQLFIKMDEGSASHATETLAQRYERILIEEPWLIQKVPQYMIASYLGVTPEAFSRVKARMNKATKRIELTKVNK